MKKGGAPEGPPPFLFVSGRRVSQHWPLPPAPIMNACPFRVMRMTLQVFHMAHVFSAILG
jgi:hypothetical protein